MYVGVPENCIVPLFRSALNLHKPKSHSLMPKSSLQGCCTTSGLDAQRQTCAGMQTAARCRGPSASAARATRQPSSYAAGRTVSLSACARTRWRGSAASSSCPSASRFSGVSAVQASGLRFGFLTASLL